MAKSRTGSEVSLPEPTTWARAVVLATGILGVTLTERTLSAKNLDELGHRVLDVIRVASPAAKKLVEALEARLPELGVDTTSDRLITAKCARSLCEAIAGKNPREVVEALSTARLETSSSAVQASLAGAMECLETLDDALVFGVIKQLIGRERHDLSASNYLREARSILRQDEMRRPMAVELRMVAGAAQAYLLTGTPSVDGRGAKEDVESSSRPRSTVIASVVAPAQVRIESSRPKAPPPSATRPKSSVTTKRSALSQTLASEGIPPLTRIGVERRGSVSDKKSARAMLAEAVKEAEAQLDAAKGPIMMTVVVTLDVSDKGGPPKD